jgi:CheY-like chemotaxis protein
LNPRILGSDHLVLAEHSFALAILDLRMPGMDGLELLAKMRENGIEVPALRIELLSGSRIRMVPSSNREKELSRGGPKHVDCYGSLCAWNDLETFATPAC